MKIFLDTADLQAIQTWHQTGLIDGITTNPSLLSKRGASDVKSLLTDICSVVGDGDVSIEVTEHEPDSVYRQAHEIAALAENVVVKIPCHPLYFSTINKLALEGVALNITLVFSLAQGLMMSKLGVQYISPFIGRLDDIGGDGIQLVQDLRAMVDEYGFQTEILAASIRHVRHLHEALQAGADAVTVPVAVLEAASHHPLTDAGIATFNADWKKLGITRFP